MWWLEILIPLGWLLVLTIATTENCSPKSCNKDMDNEKSVCGSDGLTYPSRCLLEKVRCANKNVTLVKRGPCRQQRSCRDWESYKRNNPGSQYNSNIVISNFTASCHPDGTYASAQCHPDAGHCWCVTPQGLPLPYTSVRWKPDTKPHCGRNQNKKKTTRRRSSPSSRKGRACKQPDKAKFNNNLINIFHTEWSRDHGGIMKPHNNETDLLVNQWKFSTLDLNGDGFLDKNEYKDLKRVAKKAVKPKRCARTFPRPCDVNSDTLISQQEWTECLTRDGMDDEEDQISISADTQDGGGGGGDDPDDYPDLFMGSPNRPSPHALIGQVGQNYEDETSSEIRDDDPTDCLSDRQAALMDGGQFYVPECTPDGRYKKIQCYKAAGYCFCVHEDTGKNIPGTSVKNGTPKCDQLTSINRPMKGCPDEKKAMFLRDLIEFLHTKMSEIINGTKSLNDLPWISSREEQAATWSFVVFDKNKNKMLDRNEWKSFKEIVSNVKSLKKCGKKLPRYCDINKDRHISMTEWLDCLNVKQVAPTSPPNSSRAGKKNPLSMLMED